MLAFFDTLLRRELTGHIESDDENSDDENSDGSLFSDLIILYWIVSFFSK
jgi:hypothetical protein